MRDSPSKIVSRCLDLAKKSVSRWLDKLVDIGKATTSGNTTRKAFDALESAKSLLAIELLPHWVIQADETIYSLIQPQNMLANGSWFGLKRDIRKVMYGILETTKMIVLRSVCLTY